MKYSVEEYKKMVKFACEKLDTYTESNIDCTVINDCFDNTPENQLKAFELYVLKDMTYVEVGKELNVSKTKARELCMKVVGRIRQYYLHPDETREVSLSSDIELMNLSTKTYNALKRSGISTIKQLMDRFDTLQNVYNLGSLGLKEIKFSLALFGFIEPEEEEITVTFRMLKKRVKPGYNNIAVDYNPTTGVFTFINSL